MKVLLVRADGIGDALACAPLIAALRDAGHTVGAVLGTRNREAFSRDAFAHVHSLERIPWPAHGSMPASRKRALAEARGAAYDVALIASEEIDAYTFARDAGIATRVGFVNGWDKPFKSAYVGSLLTRSLMRAGSAKRAQGHEAETLFALGHGLHGEARPTRDLARLRRLVLDAPPETHDSVAVQVSGKFARFGLDVAAYGALARRLAAAQGPVLLLGDESDLIERVAREAGVAGETRLDVVAWKARLAGSRAVVTPDSGAAHVAGFVGVPCVDCFAPHAATVRDIVRWRPWASPFRAHVLDATLDPGALAERLVSDVTSVLSGERARVA